MAEVIDRRSGRLIPVPGGFILCMLVVFSAKAQDTLQDDLNACNAVPDSQERLACFEALADEPRAVAPDTPPPVAEDRAADPVRSPVTPVRQSETAGSDNPDFGLEHKQAKTPDSETEPMQFTVSAARHNDFTGWTIAFENGQVWRQVGTDRYDIRVGDTYTIQPASFNSFLLGNNRNNRKIRVSRVE